MSNGNHSKDLAHWFTLELWGPEEGPSFNLYHTLMSTRNWAYIQSINLAHLMTTKIFSNGRLSQYASAVTHMNLINLLSCKGREHFSIFISVRVIVELSGASLTLIIGSIEAKCIKKTTMPQHLKERKIKTFLGNNLPPYKFDFYSMTDTARTGL